jgi:hypothetical protein
MLNFSKNLFLLYTKNRRVEAAALAVRKELDAELHRHYYLTILEILRERLLDSEQDARHDCCRGSEHQRIAIEEAHRECDDRRKSRTADAFQEPFENRIHDRSDWFRPLTTSSPPEREPMGWALELEQVPVPELAQDPSNSDQRSESASAQDQ